MSDQSITRRVLPRSGRSGRGDVMNGCCGGVGRWPSFCTRESWRSCTPGPRAHDLRNLSLGHILRHRSSMPFHYEARESSGPGLLTLALGAVAGLAVGVVVAQRFGGLAGITARLRERLGEGMLESSDGEYDIEDYESDELDEAEDDEEDVVLEERVLEA